MEQVEIKVGFVNALAIKLTNEQLELILKGLEELESFNSYFEIPDQDWGTDLVACVVQTMGEKDEAFEAKVSEKMKASMISNGVPEELIQEVFWKVKCEASPNNSILVWMSENQYSELEYETVYVFIGILQKQWSVKSKEKDKQGNYKYENFTTKPEGQSFESHSLKLVDFIS